MLPTQVKDLLENAQKTAKNLRSEVKIIGETVSGSFAAVHRNNKIARLKETTRLLKVIQTVQQSPATIRLLISTYDFSAAKEYIETIREVLQNELQGISGLKNLHAELDNAEKQLNGILVEEASSIFEVKIQKLIIAGKLTNKLSLKMIEQTAKIRYILTRIFASRFLLRFT